jgi:GDP-L-fucose synthase
MDSNSKIFVAGHNGLVGSAIVRKLRESGYNNLLLVDRSECDLTSKEQVENLFAIHQPQYVFLAAAKVGGILANSTYPADFIYDNLMIQANVIDASSTYKVEKLLFLGSSCIYPNNLRDPITEDKLNNGPLEQTNKAYAIAKIAGIHMCDAYREQHGLNSICVMPTNLYGPNDNFDLQTSHVLPALIRKFHDAKVNGNEVVECFGDGSPLREFLYVDDLADACVFLMEKFNQGRIINIGTGVDLTIKELAQLIAKTVGFTGKISWDTTKPNGTLRKVLNIDLIKTIGWEPKTSLEEGIAKTYEWYKENLA